MNNMERHVIRLVQDVAKEYTSARIPIFYKICSSLGLDVKEGLLPPGKDGMYEGGIIIINSAIKNEERKRFTQFHELTHHLIKEDEDLISELHDLTFDQEGEFDRQIEKFCNIGAAEFLMPRNEFKKLYMSKGYNVELILNASRHFKSSTIATTIQLAQVAPNECITAVFEYGLITNNTTPLQDSLFNTKYHPRKPKLHIIYSASSPASDRWLTKHTIFPDDHLIYQVFSENRMLEGESYIPFPGWQEPCICEALRHKDRVYALFHLSPVPDPNQTTLF